MRKTLKERLDARLQPAPCPLDRDRQGRPITTPCLLWSGSTTRGGYGTIGYTNTSRLVHRVAFALTHEVDVMSFDVLDHRCRVRNCCQVDHLEETGQPENVRRGETGAHLRAKTHCPQGHAYDEANTYRTPPKRHSPNGARVC